MGAFLATETTRLAGQAAADLPLWHLRSTLALMRGALRGGAGLEELLLRHPALHDTLDAADHAGLAGLTLDEGLARLATRLEHGASDTPLQRLRTALGLDADGLCCLAAAALADTEPRLASLVDELHGQGGQPTRATLTRAFGAAEAAAAVQILCEAGALKEDGRSLAAPRALWALACGLPAPRDAWRHRPLHALAALEHLILPAALLSAIHTVQRRSDGASQVWVLRGPPGSGRHALAGALAQAVGLGLVEAVDQAHTRALGAAAALLGALPLAHFDPAPGEAVNWALPPGSPPWLAVCMPRHGALKVAGAVCHRLHLDLPDAAERAAHWRVARGGRGADAALSGWEPGADLLALRLPRGTLHRVARRVAPDSADELGDVIAAVTEQGRHALEGIARAVPPASADEPLALPEDTQQEFDALVLRCRHRDRLSAALPAAFGSAAGVRALFKGPSGTGKTLAARQLAAALRRPLYRVDLAATVSKYIGETERNLERVFEAAESLDIVLLLDEGDALLAGRTGVSNATDRYANLETNYLLQRLEHYSGVLVVTTNAADRIDSAFARRMDVSIDFPLPDAITRLALWDAHLGPQHQVPGEVLERVALRCALAGGQIRNAALHAALLAISEGRQPGALHLQLALEREYRKAGQRCPSVEPGD
jgi:hypothetical protein